MISRGVGLPPAVPQISVLYCRDLSRSRFTSWQFIGTCLLLRTVPLYVYKAHRKYRNGRKPAGKTTGIFLCLEIQNGRGRDADAVHCGSAGRHLGSCNHPLIPGRRHSFLFFTLFSFSAFLPAMAWLRNLSIFWEMIRGAWGEYLIHRFSFFYVYLL